MAAFRLSPPSSPEFFSRSQPPASRLSPQCKCAQYWPDQGCWTYGNIRVSVEDVTVLVDYTVRKFCIQQVLHPPQIPPRIPPRGRCPLQSHPTASPPPFRPRVITNMLTSSAWDPVFHSRQAAARSDVQPQNPPAVAVPFGASTGASSASRAQTKPSASAVRVAFPRLSHPSLPRPTLRGSGCLRHWLFSPCSQRQATKMSGGAWGMRESGWG